MPTGTQRFDPTRRGFLRAASLRRATALRPPWALAEPVFAEQCTRCAECIRACPEGILREGSGGFPELDFALGGCTFCGDCRAACEPGALVRSVEPPVAWRAVIAAACLATRGVTCRACADECETRAIRFRPLTGGSAEVRVIAEACNGCGACVRFCPVSAIRLETGSQPREAA